MAKTKKKNKNKQKPKKIAAPKSGPSSSNNKSKAKKKGDSSKVASKILQPRVLSTFAFGLSGLVAGLATGLNHFPNLEQSPTLPKMLLLAAYLGDPHVDIQTGLITGLAGLMIGACLGFSALSDPKDMVLSLVVSIIFATLVITVTGNPLLAGLGFLFGHTPAILAYLRLRKAEA